MMFLCYFCAESYRGTNGLLWAPYQIRELYGILLCLYGAEEWRGERSIRLSRRSRSARSKKEVETLCTDRVVQPCSKRLLGRPSMDGARKIYHERHAVSSLDPGCRDGIKSRFPQSHIFTISLYTVEYHHSSVDIIVS